MYLPRNLPLCEPHVVTWVGESGKRYDFAVSRPAMSWLDEAAVFLLAKRTGQETKVLHIGHTCSLHKRFGHASERCPEIWRRALAAGMTHVHLRFEACSERERQCEVNDLRTALRPSIDEIVRWEEEPPITIAAPSLVSNTANDVLVPYRARLKPTRSRDPHLDIEAFDEDAQRGDLPIGHAFEAPRVLRSDPAREVSFDEELSFGEPDTALDEKVVNDNLTLDVPPASIAILPALRLMSEPAELPEVRTEAPSRPGNTELKEAEVTAAPPAECVSITTADAEPLHLPPQSSAGNEKRSAGSRLARMVADGVRWLGSFVGSRAPAIATAEKAREPQFPNRAERPATIAEYDEQVTATLVDVGDRGEPETDVLAVSEIRKETATPPAPSSMMLAGDDTAVFVQLPVSSDDDDSGALPITGSADSSPSEAVPVGETNRESPGEVKRSLDLDPTAPLVLFAGAISYEAGADILADAIVTVCGGDASAQFVFAGEGALRGELQDRMVYAGLGNRCRFIGDVPSGRFEQLLKACDFVVIPARFEQGEELARFALLFDRPALVTHQSGIRCIVHGENGLITYDNPGSFVWGIREMLGPLNGKLGRRHAQAA